MQTFNINRFASGRPATGNAELSMDEIRRRAPSVFAEGAHESRSERYLYVPTARILEGLRAEGFVPTAAFQGRSRIEGKAEYTKHLIRLRHLSDVSRDLGLGEVFPEVVLLNSHDGTSSYRIMAGLFRLVCTNGLITGESFKDVRVPHSHKQREAVIEGTYQVIEESRRAIGAASAMRQLTLDRDERQAFAEAVHMVRFEDSPSQAEAIRPERMIEPRRREDQSNDLWTVFNVAQENALRGGVHGARRDDNGIRRLVTTRAVNGIDGQTTLNRALWALSERMAELKGSPVAQAA